MDSQSKTTTSAIGALVLISYFYEPLRDFWYDNFSLNYYITEGIQMHICTRRLKFGDFRPTSMMTLWAKIYGWDQDGEDQWE